MKHLAVWQRHAMTSVCLAGLFGPLSLATLQAQTTPAKPSEATAEAGEPGSVTRAEEYERFRTSSVDREYKLKYAASPADANELLTAMRNMLDPQTKIFLVPSTGIVVVHAPEEVQATVRKLIDALDLPHPRYRLTYTLTELDGTRKIGVQHFSVVANSKEKAVLKQGSRIPIQIGNGGSSLPNATQITYIDIGMNFEVYVSEIQGGALLRSKVEQTSTAPDSTSPSNPNPIIRQTYLEGTATLLTGKPALLGSIDVPGSTHHFDVEVVLESAS
jgi:type II secretory pathway component GspD/PulD (secretin)